MNTTHLTLLSELGLTEKEAKIYLATLELGSGSVADIAIRSGVKRTTIYNFIDLLIEKGLLRRSVLNGKTVYRAVQPDGLVDLQEKRLHDLRSQLGELVALANSSDSKPRIEYFEGTQQMQQIGYEEVNCHKELLAIWNRKRVVEQLGGKKFLEELEQKRREKGIRIRLIAVQDEEEGFTGSGSGPDDMREIRYVPRGMEFPMGISIYDTGKVAFLTSKEEAIGIVIESKELEITMRRLFEAFWEMSGMS